jgi:hypothetical protein
MSAIARIRPRGDARWTHGRRVPETHGWWARGGGELMRHNDGVTTATATRPPAASAKPDQACAEAVDLARAAVTEDVAGAYIEVVADGERVATHYFECQMSGYVGWRWGVTVARASRSKLVTVCETVLLPGPDALVTPDWIPWQDRVAPGDLGVGDLMPTAADDDRLAPAYLLSDDPAVEDVVWELGLGRVRVLSREGRIDAADRWYAGDQGPEAPISVAAPPGARCVSCGFYLPLAGAMRAAFGVCANLYAPDDGRAVSADHGCGAHSEVLVEQTIEVDEAPTIYDDSVVDPVEVTADPDAAAEPIEIADAVIEEPLDMLEEPSDVVEELDAVIEPEAVVDVEPIDPAPTDTVAGHDIGTPDEPADDAEVPADGGPVRADETRED